MPRLRIAEEFSAEAESAATPDALKRAAVRVKKRIGFDFIAITHHANIDDGCRVIRIDDYPEPWATEFDRRRLGRSDPVHRASHAHNRGFLWSEMEHFIQMDAADRAIFAQARRYGVGDGFTVPANVPGECNGSVSFAVAAGRPLPLDMLPVAELVAGHAFHAARRLWRMRPSPLLRPMLTDAQRLCLMWTMRGKSDWETSRIVGCQPGTVVRHIKLARERYDVDKRTLLLTRTLLDGTLSLADLNP